MLSNATRSLCLRTRYSARTLSSLNTTLEAQLQEIKSQGTYKHERVITTPQNSTVRVDNKDPVINFCANNYLGLADHPQVKTAAFDAIETHGFGLASVRFICGTQDIHKQLEAAIAKFHGMDDAILYPSCFDANAGLFEAVLGPEDAILSDELNHASIIDGVRLCKAKRLRFKHMDMEDLEAKLIEAKDSRVRLIATDGVFSMDGDVAPLDKICDLAEKHDATVFIDECHATGILGASGRGTIEHFKLSSDRVGIINSTLGKALGGGTGGYTAGSQQVVDMLRQKARPYLFSNTVAPPVVGASIKVFEMLQHNGAKYVDELRSKTHALRDRLTAGGFKLGGEYDHPIVPIIIGDAKLTADVAQALLQRGIYVIGFSYPVVGMGLARIRIQVSCSHTIEQIEQTANAFITVGKEFNII